MSATQEDTPLAAETPRRIDEEAVEWHEAPHWEPGYDWTQPVTSTEINDGDRKKHIALIVRETGVPMEQAAAALDANKNDIISTIVGLTFHEEKVDASTKPHAQSDGDGDDEPDDTNTTRVLARIAELGPLVPIPGADRICLATIAGTMWETVVPATGTNPAYREGARGVYFEIDSVLPDAPWVAAAMLGNDTSKEKHRVIKTIKLRGVLSQGLFIHIDALGDAFPDLLAAQLDADVTRLLGVTKRPDPALPSSRRSKHYRSGPLKNRRRDNRSSPHEAYEHAFGPDGRCPNGPPKTDEPRLQNSLWMLRELAGMHFNLALKVHGSSATFGYVAPRTEIVDAEDEKELDLKFELGLPGEFIAASRNYILNRTKATDHYYQAAERYSLEATLAKHPELVVQGEVYGPDIHCNMMESPSVDFAVFNVWDRTRKTYLDEDHMREWCAAQTPPLQAVPIIESGDSFPANVDPKELLRKAEGFCPGTKNPREGLVLRPVRTTFVENNRSSGTFTRLSCKVINNEFLLAQH